MNAHDAARDDWAALVAAAPSPFITQTPEWMDCLVELGDYIDVSRQYRFSDGRQAVLPLARRSRPSRGLALYHSLPPAWGFAGLVGDDPRREDLELVLDDLAALGAASVTVRPSPFVSEAWDAAAPASVRRAARTTHIVDLADGFEAIWLGRVKGSTRTRVRRAEREGVVVEQDATGAYIDAFYDLYVGWLRNRARRRRLPLPVATALGRRREPRRKFEVVAQAFPQACTTWVALLNDRPVASCIQLTYGDHSVYWRGYSNLQVAGPTRANYLLQKVMIEEAVNRGCRWHHLGESGGVESLMRFKAAFGADQHRSDAFHLDRVPIRGVRQVASRARSHVEAALARRSPTSAR